MAQLKNGEELCANCGEPSNFNCGRCLVDSYCSKECQTNDFIHHRFICFPLPDLMPIVKDTPSSSIDNEKLDGKENQLETSEIKKEDDGLEQQNDMIKLDNSIRQDDTIIGTLSITSSFEEELSDEDDGFIDNIKQIQETFESLENEKNLRITANMKKNEALSQKTCNEVIVKSDKFFMMNDLKIHEWPKAKNIKVKLQHILQPPNIMAFVEAKKLIDDFYDFMESEIKKYRPCISEDYHKYLPKTNEIVLAQYNGSWYRAVVLDADSNGVIVLFIDYGNMELLLTDEILPISNEYFISKLSFEVCSRQFIVDNVPSELDEKQQEILDSKSMMITNIRVDDKGFSHCEIFGF